LSQGDLADRRRKCSSQLQPRRKEKMATTVSNMGAANVVSHEEWIRSRKQFLAKEKEFTRLRDELSRERRELPWERVEKKYEFDGPQGRVTLADLFEGRGQLVIYHFMLGPGWAEGCPSCSYLADHFDPMTIHLANRDVTLAVVSRAPIAEIETFRRRMGWGFRWLSSYGSDFNQDYQASASPEEAGGDQAYYNYDMMPFPSSERPGLSVFSQSPEGVFHTYSTYARGLDILVGTYNFLDLVPKGRDEGGFKHTMAWVRHHDKYSEGYYVDPAANYQPPKVVAGKGSCCSGETRD
jgi:predicted dithiol-disulfide oxidoreductase (DUF899 family)